MKYVDTCIPHSRRYYSMIWTVTLTPKSWFKVRTSLTITRSRRCIAFENWFNTISVFNAVGSGVLYEIDFADEWYSRFSFGVGVDAGEGGDLSADGVVQVYDARVAAVAFPTEKCLLECDAVSVTRNMG